MNSHDDDETYNDLEDAQPKRSKHTKFRDLDNKDRKGAKRDKPHNKRSHRPKTKKDDHWPDTDD